MNPPRRVTRYLSFTVLLVLSLASLVSMNFVPGVHLGGGTAGAVHACEGLPGRAVPSQGTEHLGYLGERHVRYATSPPTSGPHMPWLISAGVYRSPIAPEFQVHLLEHGKVLIQYSAGVNMRIRDELELFARRRPDMVVVAPSTEVRSEVALTAWQRIDRAGIHDQPRIQRFVDALSGRYDHGWAGDASDCIRRPR
jgi:hypothetical protein